MGEKDLSVIVVTYKTKDLLYKALHSVLTNLEHAHFSHEVIVVDNNSSDDTLEMLRENFKEILADRQFKKQGSSVCSQSGHKNCQGTLPFNYG